MNKARIYWGKETEDAIQLYQQTRDEDLFTEKIYPKFHHMAEAVLLKMQPQHLYLDQKHCWIDTCVTKLWQSIRTYDYNKGRSYSYFSFIAKTTYIKLSNDLERHFKRSSPLSTHNKNGDIKKELVYTDEDKIQDPNEKLFMSLLAKKLRSELHLITGPTGLRVGQSIVDIIHENKAPESRFTAWINRQIRHKLGGHIADNSITRIRERFKVTYKAAKKEFRETGTIK